MPRTMRGSMIKERATMGNKAVNPVLVTNGKKHSGKVSMGSVETYDLAMIFREIVIKFENEKECNEIDCAFINMARQLRQITPDNILDLIYKIKELEETQLGKKICNEDGKVIRRIPGKYDEFECIKMVKGVKRRRQFESKLRTLSLLLRSVLNKDNILETIYKIKEMDDEYSKGSRAKLGEIKNTTCCSSALPETFKTHLCDDNGEYICPGDDEEGEEETKEDCDCSS